MATDFHTFGMLLKPKSAPPRFSNGDDIAEFIGRFYDRPRAKAESLSVHQINYVCSCSRRGRLIYVLELLCKAAHIENLGFLYGAANTRHRFTSFEFLFGTANRKHEFAINESSNGIGVWCTWRGLCLDSEDLQNADLAITALFEWSRRNQEPLKALDSIFKYTREGDLIRCIDQPIITTEPTADQRIWDTDEGDSVGCLYSYLASMRQLMRNAARTNNVLWYMVQAFR